MHELGTIVYVIDTVEKIAAENKLAEVASVTLEVGEVSGIVPSYLADFWLYARKKSELLKETELKTKRFPPSPSVRTASRPIRRSSLPRSVRTVTARTPSLSPATNTTSKK